MKSFKISKKKSYISFALFFFTILILVFFFVLTHKKIEAINFSFSSADFLEEKNAENYFLELEMNLSRQSSKIMKLEDEIGLIHSESKLFNIQVLEAISEFENKVLLSDKEKILSQNDSIEILQKDIENLKVLLGQRVNSQIEMLDKINLLLVGNNSYQKINTENHDIVLEQFYNDGLSLYRNKKFIEALMIFTEAFKLYPYDREIKYYYLASLYYSSPQNRNNYPYLKEQFELLTHDLQYSEKSLNILADISLSENDLEKAFTLYKKLYEMSETNLEYLKSLGMIQYQLGLFPAAHKSFQSYLYTYPEDYEVLYFDGISLYGQGFYKDALKQFYLVQKSDTPYGNIENKIRETTEQLENL